MARDGAFAVFTLGTTIRTLGVLAMALPGRAASPILLLAALAMRHLPGGTDPACGRARIVGVDVADDRGRCARLLLRRLRGRRVVGSLLAGILADQVGFNAINWMAAVAGGLAVALLFAGMHRDR